MSENWLRLRQAVQRHSTAQLQQADLNNNNTHTPLFSRTHTYTHTASAGMFASLDKVHEEGEGGNWNEKEKEEKEERGGRGGERRHHLGRSQSLNFSGSSSSIALPPEMRPFPQQPILIQGKGGGGERG